MAMGNIAAERSRSSTKLEPSFGFFCRKTLLWGPVYFAEMLHLPQKHLVSLKHLMVENMLLQDLMYISIAFGQNFAQNKPW